MIVAAGVVFMAWGLALVTNFRGVTDWQIRRRRWWLGDMFGPGSSERPTPRRLVRWWRGSAVLLVAWGGLLVFLGATGRWS